MRYKELAPEKGMMYALYQGKMEYKAFNKAELPEEDKIKEALLELHLFDNNKEYRYIQKRNGCMEMCIECTDESHDDMCNNKENIKIIYSDGREETSTSDTYKEKIYTLGNIKGENGDKDYIEEHIDIGKTNKKQVVVVNYISYDDNDLLVINNFRLKMPEREGDR